MWARKGAAAYLFDEKYVGVTQTVITDELTNPSQVAFDSSPNIGDSKLKPSEVYQKILDKDFLLAHPEKTKTSRSPISVC